MEDPIEEVVALGEGRDLLLRRPRDAEALIDERAFEVEDEFLPYWAELWPSAIALARVVSRRTLHGRRVLELGCGLGLPSLAAAAGGARVLATDWSSEALEAVQENATRNELTVETLRLDWRSPEAVLERAPWDLVLAADVLYETRNVEPLLELLPQLGREVLLADPDRATAAPFLAAAPREWSVSETRHDRVRVHQLRR